MPPTSYRRADSGAQAVESAEALGSTAWVLDEFGWWLDELAVAITYLPETSQLTDETSVSRAELAAWTGRVLADAQQRDRYCSWTQHEAMTAQLAVLADQVAADRGALRTEAARSLHFSQGKGDRRHLETATGQLVATFLLAPAILRAYELPGSCAALREIAWLDPGVQPGQWHGVGRGGRPSPHRNADGPVERCTVCNLDLYERALPAIEMMQRHGQMMLGTSAGLRALTWLVNAPSPELAVLAVRARFKLTDAVSSWAAAIPGHLDAREREQACAAWAGQVRTVLALTGR